MNRTVDQIAGANNISNPNAIKVSQQLAIPDKTYNPPKQNKPVATKRAPVQTIQARGQNGTPKVIVSSPGSARYSRKVLNSKACGGLKHYNRNIKNIGSLHPYYQPYVIELINKAYAETGVCLVITDGYRSPKTQGGLSKSVTSAGPLQSYHQYGLAIDIVSVTDGEITYLKDGSLSVLNSKKIGPVGESLGLKWGGRWKKKDWPHFEIHPNGKSWRQLKPQLLRLGISNYKKLIF